ncbi:MAG: hypothetical protein AD742_05180 [Methylibium sp. NZG]|nr:MAG: hypothetical protein AD742_05180 [Methylibium sp. NZG]
MGTDRATPARHTWRWAVTALAALFLAGPASAAEIVLELSAVDKLVAQGLFSNGGRYDLVRGPCSAYLDRPSVSIGNGRVRIRSHLTARVGVPSGTSCMGVAFASWTEVSGKPVPKGGSVVLADIRIDKVDDPNLRLVLESGLVPALPRVVELDVLKSVRGMLQSNGGQFQASVDAFAIESVTAADDRLTVRFDFLLVAR